MKRGRIEGIRRYKELKAKTRGGRLKEGREERDRKEKREQRFRKARKKGFGLYRRQAKYMH
jgi:hypothetical protein